jgi:uncharacterized protein YlxW (UPF0749 family)
MHGLENDSMLDRKWSSQLLLTTICLVLGLLLVVQLRSQRELRQAAGDAEWGFVVAELIESNTRLRDEIGALQTQLAELQDLERGGVVLESLVDEVNHLRIANGLVEVSGPGVELEIRGPVSVLDLHDLINELRNAGAEALALNGQRVVASSAISTDGEHVTVDGLPVPAPYRLEAIGEAHTLEVALTRPGGLVDLLLQSPRGILIAVSQRDKVTMPVYGQPMRFVYAEPLE